MLRALDLRLNDHSYHASLVERGEPLPYKTRRCRRAEAVDYLIYYGSDFFKGFLEAFTKAQNSKPPNQRNAEFLLLAEVGKVMCSVVKVGVNEDLCEPIGYGPL